MHCLFPPVRVLDLLEIAAAGNHNLLFIGPPGTGKRMLARRLPGLLPRLSDAEALATAAVNSIAGQSVAAANWRVRPFRAPHHTASAAALVGGGPGLRPGEVSRAHNGVLFLDELPEFGRHVLETLSEQFKLRMRQGAGQPVRPSEFGRVRKHIARIRTVLTEKRSGEAS